MVSCILNFFQSKVTPDNTKSITYKTTIQNSQEDKQK